VQGGLWLVTGKTILLRFPAWPIRRTCTKLPQVVRGFAPHTKLTWLYQTRRRACPSVGDGITGR